MGDPLKIEGLAAVSRLLKEFPEKLQANVIQGAMLAAAKSMVEPLQAAAPVRTGRLELSIRARRTTARAGALRLKASGILEVGAVVAIDSPGRRYWHLTEFGTVKMAARPWVRPTFAANQERVIAAVRKYVGPRAVREGKKLGQQAT